MSGKTVSTARVKSVFDGKSEDRGLAASVRTSFVGRVCGISVLLPGCQRGAGVVEYLEKQCRQFQCRKKSLCMHKLRVRFGILVEVRAIASAQE